MIEFSNLKEMPAQLSKLQAVIVNPKRTTKAYNYKYANMDEVLECLKKPCEEFGFSIVQMPYNDNDFLGVETLLIHNSGEFIKGRFGSKIVKHDPQSVGSQVSYYRRYSLLALFNLSQEDDDGASLKNSRPEVESKPEELATDGQKKFLIKLMGIDDYNQHRVFIEKKMTKKQAMLKIEELNGSKK